MTQDLLSSRIFRDIILKVRRDDVLKIKNRQILNDQDTCSIHREVLSISIFKILAEILEILEDAPEILKKSWKVFKNREGFEDQRTKCTNIHDSNILLIVYLEYFVLSISCKSLRLIWWLIIACVFELQLRKIGTLRNFRKRWIPCMNQTIWYLLIWYNLLYDFKVTLVNVNNIKWFRDWGKFFYADQTRKFFTAKGIFVLKNWSIRNLIFQ